MATIMTQTAPIRPAATPQQHVFEREFLPLADDLYTFAWRLTNDSTRAEDLVQETYMKAWRFIGRYEAGTYAKAWLFKICRNAFINEYRSRKNQPYKVDYEDIVVYHNEDDAATHRYLDLHDEMHGKLIGDEVTRAINELSPGFRLVVLLDLEDFTYEEIAAIADIPIGTVRSRLHRARNVLASKLRDYAEDKGYNVTDGDTPSSANNDTAESPRA
ncbi:MAG: sigma-70 family RNA polymerase sigma factor [Saprospiraceae bacterium]